jgi:ankyrin repeat protein
LEKLERKRVREQNEEQLEVQNEEKGRVVDMVDEDGWTVVMASCYAGHSDCLKLLLQHGASRNSRCHEAG